VFLRGRGRLIAYLTGLALLLLSCLFESFYRAAAELEKTKMTEIIWGTRDRVQYS